ncbi:MAG: hypothetical protein KIT36_22455 [Alphaproteobacteria bacterium]|nr:hypothetical protein [Alphaproteobacteria bacterium]
MTNLTANALVNNFAAASGNGVWPGLARATLAQQLRDRIASPSSVNQASTPFCGPASFVRLLALEKPDAYAQAAIDLFNTGECTIGTLKVKPGDTVRKSAPQNKTSQADWIMLASIRDSGNAVLSAGGLLGGSAAGITLPGTLSDWFTKAGFTTVVNKASVTQPSLPNAQASLVQSAKTYKTSGHHIVMLVDADVLKDSNQDDEISIYPDHWITLTTDIKDGGELAYNEPISMWVYTWGDQQTIPKLATKPLKKKYFMNKFYGFIAVKT